MSITPTGLPSLHVPDGFDPATPHPPNTNCIPAWPSFFRVTISATSSLLTVVFGVVVPAIVQKAPSPLAPDEPKALEDNTQAAAPRGATH